MVKRSILAALATLFLAFGAQADGIDAGWEAFLAGDYGKAIREWRPLAENGDPRAQVFMATIYNTGSGVPKDFTAGAEWLTRAANQGNDQAQFGLGLAHLRGQGVAKDLVAAHMWFDLAAASGHQRAADSRERVAKRLTRAQVEKARNMARNWTAAHGKK